VRWDSEVVTTVSKSQYTVIYERDESEAWLARVAEVPGCHTYGRSIRQAQRRIREALELWVDDAEQAELLPKIRLPRQAQTAVRKAKAARARAARDQREAAEATQRATHCLASLGLSARDASEVLGISHQRAHQILSD
jgi:predicted RNase H-like HicB family nuclease